MLIVRSHSRKTKSSINSSLNQAKR